MSWIRKEDDVLRDFWARMNALMADIKAPIQVTYVKDESAPERSFVDVYVQDSNLPLDAFFINQPATQKSEYMMTQTTLLLAGPTEGSDPPRFPTPPPKPKVG